MPKPSPGEVIGFDMIIRVVQAGVILGKQYTALYMDQPVSFIAKFLTGILNFLFGQHR
jgi:hypothetical protein